MPPAVPDLELPRRHEAGATACDEAERLAILAGWPDADVHRLVLVLGEAVANSIEHSEGDGPIRLGLTVGPRHATVRIQDGGGLDPDQLASARLPDQPEATSGRGLYMIRKLADSVDVVEGGLAIRVVVRP